MPRWKRLDIQINKNIAYDLLISLCFSVEKFLFSAKIFRKKSSRFRFFRHIDYVRKKAGDFDMAKKKSIQVDFAKSCITYNKLNTIAKSAISDMQSFGNPITLPVEHRSSLPSYGATLTDVA